jgi:WD repeat-containing protein 35
VKAAIDCCVLLNQWDKAVQLAEEHDFPQVSFDAILGLF